MGFLMICHRLICNRALLHTQRAPRGERAASLVEYALLLALIALVCVAAVTTMGNATGSSLGNSGTSMFGP